MNNSNLTHFSLHPELIQDIMDSLINTNLLSEKSLCHLKQDSVETVEPVLKMDMRHEQVKQTYEQRQNRHQILKEARRLVEGEEQAVKEKVKEMRMVNREIQKFQKQLQTEHKKLIGEHSFHSAAEKKLWSQHNFQMKTPFIAVRTTTKKKSCRLQDMKNSDFYHDEFLNVQTLKIEEIHDESTECMEFRLDCIEEQRKQENLSDINVNQEEASFVENSSEVTHKILQKEVDNFAVESNHPMDFEYQIMNKVWIQWMRYVEHKKTSPPKSLEWNIFEQKERSNVLTVYKPNNSEVDHYNCKNLSCKNCCDFTNEVFENYENCANEYHLKQHQIQKNLAILKKYFLKWRHWMVKTRELKNLQIERQKREEKIKKYIELLENKKKSFVSSSPNSNLPSSSPTSSGNFSENSSKPIKATYKDTDYGAKYKHRFEAQKNIIAMQKSKIEDQNKEIEDLKSFQMKLEAEVSQREMNKNLRATLQNFDPKLKCKVAQIQRVLSSDSGYKTPERASTENSETSEGLTGYNALKVQSMSAEIVRRMERRNEERKKKWKAAQERKKQLEEEKVMKLKEEDEMRQKQELEAKKRKLEELKEKQKLEKQKEEQRIIDREQFQENCKIADESNRRRLLMKTLKILRNNVLKTKRDTLIAEGHYIIKLKNKIFHSWRHKVQQIIQQKINVANQFYNYCLLRTAFKRFFQVYKEYLQKLQAADDMYDMKTQQKYFIKWHSYVCTVYVETQDKLKIATNFHNRRIVRSHFNKWKKLPKIMFHEREREHRLRILRERVQELLPDYQPVPFNDDD